MSGFERDTEGRALLAKVPLLQLLETARIATPAYVYDLGAMKENLRALLRQLGPNSLVAYAVKANSAGTIVRAFAAEGAGADVVSGGELLLALECGMTPERIVMSGVAKTDAEIDLALARRIRALQVESVEEIARIGARARAAGTKARVALRVNPGVEIDSHEKIATGHDAAKFGIPVPELGDALAAVRINEGAVELVGISTHVGSLLATPEPYLDSARVVCAAAVMARKAGHPLEYVDFGGGFGIDYGGRPTCSPAEFARAARDMLRASELAELDLVVEPGRSLVGPYGVLVARVVQEKRGKARRWLMIDAGMNDLVRPAMYGAFHRIEPADRLSGAAPFRVVGPVCESSDDFGEHPIGEPVPEYVVIRDAGAYGFSMASEYNGRALPNEVFAEAGEIVKVSASAGVEDWLRRRLDA